VEKDFNRGGEGWGQVRASRPLRGQSEVKKENI